MQWIVEQLTILAVAVGSPENVTAERLRIYAQDLSEFTPEQLTKMFTVARQTSRFFPALSELRDLVTSGSDGRKIEAEAAWDFVNKYLQKYGVVHYDNDNRPQLPERIAYALRRLGGLTGLDQIAKSDNPNTWPFAFKEFCEAYGQSTLALECAPLRDLYGLLQSSTKKQLTAPQEASVPQQIGKEIPKALTDAELSNRRERLAQQRELLKNWGGK